MTLKSLTHIALAAAGMMLASPAAAQDLLAKQAPIDRQLQAVDSMVLRHLIENEEWELPSSDLYDDWDNVYAHKATELPDSFRIDLRDFSMPCDSRLLTSNFGARWGRQHKGLDIKVYVGDTIRAAFSGKVRVVRYEARGYGKYVVIRHDNGLETIYGHMSKQLVSENQEVRSGDPIGLGGNTGRSTGSHLHFETRLCGVALNPALMFDFRNQDVVADFYMFHKGTYQREGLVATRLRGVNGTSYSGETEEQASRMVGKVKPGKQRGYASSGMHKVKRGDTLSSIARKHGVSVNHLCKVNHIGKTKRLMPGQILRY